MVFANQNTCKKLQQHALLLWPSHAFPLFYSCRAWRSCCHCTCRSWSVNLLVPHGERWGEHPHLAFGPAKEQCQHLSYVNGVQMMHWNGPLLYICPASCDPLSKAGHTLVCSLEPFDQAGNSMRYLPAARLFIWVPPNSFGALHPSPQLGSMEHWSVCQQWGNFVKLR